jgi:RecA/RadA recombinase
MPRRQFKSEDKLSTQLREHTREEVKPERVYDGSDDMVISTGSTLLDLAISGGRFSRGGLPGGILVEIFGPPSSGKTVMLCEIAGNVQRQGGSVLFFDPEARLNKEFGQVMGLNTSKMEYEKPDTIPSVFRPIRKWEPKSSNKKIVHGVFADSLAALSTEMEMEDEDKMGMRRAKEFSQELRKTCRILTDKNFLMVASNQVRQNMDAGPYGLKYKSPGGEAISFYSSLRLRCMNPEKLRRKKKIRGTEFTRTYGVEVTVEVFKSSVWAPYHTAPVVIIFDYGVDDIRANLQYVKTVTQSSTYVVGNDKLSLALDDAIEEVESGLVKKLRDEVIELWHEVEEKFMVKRQIKERD